MNAQTLIMTLTMTESNSEDRVYNAQRVLFALKRLKRKSGMNNYIVRSAIRKQKKLLNSLKECEEIS
jgi:hypothetical protein